MRGGRLTLFTFWRARYSIIATQYIMYWNGDDKNAVLGAGASAAGRYDEKAAAPYGAKRD